MFYLFENKKKNDRYSVRPTKTTWEKALINKIKNQRDEVAMDTAEMQNNVREYYEQMDAI